MTDFLGTLEISCRRAITGIGMGLLGRRVPTKAILCGGMIMKTSHSERRKWWEEVHSTVASALQLVWGLILRLVYNTLIVSMNSEGKEQCLQTRRGEPQA